MQVKTNYEIARGIVRRYMAEYTGQQTPPKSIKGGFFAIIMKDTGEVWLSESTSFATTLTRFRAKSQSHANCVMEALKRGSELELWLLTQPARFSAQALENELYEADLLAMRKKPVKDGEGDLYVIRHRITQDYFVVTNRQAIAESTILSNFLTRLVNMGGNSRNKLLHDFVTDQADDILAQRNFDITHIAKFLNKEDEWLERQVYIDRAIGRNLNFLSVD
uniref:Uncharacterized protein n=1 Tax=Pseudomonas phage RVTF4 TaxID=3236931 RepID=A0AB39CCP5_9VIRU